MPLLAEQERLIMSDLPLINDAANYSTSSTTFVTLHDYGNVILANAGILLIAFTSTNPTVSNGYIRIKVGSKYVMSLFLASGNGSQAGAIYLPAGTYDILAEGRVSGNTLNISNMKVGYTNFNDLQASAEDVYSSSIPLTVANRKTPVGALAQATWLVQCFASTPSGQANFENVGDNLTNGVSITIDGTQESWNGRWQDTLSKEAASALLALPYSVGSAHTVAISKRNANTVVNISIIACPWILSSSVYEPVAFDFSQGSTYYCTLNALFKDPTKFVGIGTPRGISFGSTYDYYSTTSATGLLTYSITMDIYDVTYLICQASGIGGCIEIVGADIR
jgi:hypothetical protein